MPQNHNDEKNIELVETKPSGQRRHKSRRNNENITVPPCLTRITLMQGAWSGTNTRVTLMQGAWSGTNTRVTLMQGAWSSWSGTSQAERLLLSFASPGVGACFSAPSRVSLLGLSAAGLAGEWHPSSASDADSRLELLAPSPPARGGEDVITQRRSEVGSAASERHNAKRDPARVKTQTH
jgi:hypothetical protein